MIPIVSKSFVWELLKNLRNNEKPLWWRYFEITQITKTALGQSLFFVYEFENCPCHYYLGGASTVFNNPSLTFAKVF